MGSGRFVSGAASGIGGGSALRRDCLCRPQRGRGSECDRRQHQGGPLGHGGLDADGILCCPWHAWEFDCHTGADPRNPGVSVPKYSVRIDGGDILIEVP